MRKIRKQLIKKSIVPILLLVISISSLCISASLKVQSFYLIITAVFFILPAIISGKLMLKIFPINNLINILEMDLKSLKKKKYFYGTITADNSKNYLKKIYTRLTSHGFKDITKEKYLPYENYNFLLKKHYWYLDSTCIHVHMASLPCDTDKIKEYLKSIIDKEINLDYGKFKGNYSSIINIIAIENFIESPEMISLVDDIFFIEDKKRNTKAVNIFIDVTNNRIYFGDSGYGLFSESQKIMQKYILDLKIPLRKCPGASKDSEKEIMEIEKALNEFDIKDFNNEEEINKEREIIARLNNNEFIFCEEKDKEEGARIYYKSEKNVLEIDCGYDIEKDKYIMCDLDNLFWNYPKFKAVKKKEKDKILNSLFKFLNDNNIKYEIETFIYTKENRDFYLKKKDN